MAVVMIAATAATAASATSAVRGLAAVPESKPHCRGDLCLRRAVGCQVVHGVPDLFVDVHLKYVLASWAVVLDLRVARPREIAERTEPTFMPNSWAISSSGSPR